MRWELADGPHDQGALFEQPVFEREPGRGEFRGMEFLHVRARSIINEIKGGAAYLPFRFTINAYRGCSHACSYCTSGDTPVLMADGTTRPIADLRAGDRVYGTVRRGNYRRYEPTTVLDHWSTWKRAYRITLADGTTLVASGDHRFLTGRGWKFVTGAGCGAACGPHLTTSNSLLGVGHFADPPKKDDDYRRGYLTGMIRGDGTNGTCRNGVRGVHLFGLPLVDETALDRIRSVVAWPAACSDGWSKGFLAGSFDAAGSHSRGVLRISNKDAEIIERLTEALRRVGFTYVVEGPNAIGVRTVRVRGGLRERLRFFLTTDPTITRKRTIDGVAVKSDADLRVVSVEPLGIEIPMYDITTGTGDFIANGVVSHNCFARPTHAYLDMDIGEDFERRIVVKVNAVERLRVELDPRRWAGDHIAMGTNTDPYQRCEGKYRLTRGIVEMLGVVANPFSILTKSTLILRDLDLLVAAAERTSVRVNLSIGTLDEDVWRATEPGTPHPRQRVEAVRKLNDAGIPTGVLVAPILPGISDGRGQIDEVVGACVDAGAVSVSSVLLHLRPGVKEHFLDSLRVTRPDLVDRYTHLYGDRAYAPKDERRRVSALVQRALKRHGGVRPVTFKDQVPTETAVTTPKKRPAQTRGQLNLL